MKARVTRASPRSRIAAKLTTASDRTAVEAPTLLAMRKGALLILATTLLAAGCGGSKGAGNAKGAKVFASAGCGGCHTLSAAKSTGQTGPNLDQLKPSYDAVVRQVSNGGGGMPSFTGKLSTGQIRDLAGFIAAS